MIDPNANPYAMAGIHITDIESAINWWRAQFPSPDGITACPEVLALAEVYALMVYYREHEADEFTLPKTAREAWLDLVRVHARRAVHRDLLDLAGRRPVQGLRPHVRGGAALDGDDAGPEARGLAPHHAGRQGLALQQVRRARRPRHRRGSPGSARLEAGAA
jgi:hypothetical protein